DQLIMPRGVINYYRQMASRVGHGAGKGPDFEELQSFYRLFRAPGVGHCGGGSGPQPQNLFGALVEWVEHGVAPDQILAQTTSGAGSGRGRPYRKRALYKGAGAQKAGDGLIGGGVGGPPEVVAADVLTKYKKEVRGPLAFPGGGVNRHICFGGAEPK